MKMELKHGYHVPKDNKLSVNHEPQQIGCLRIDHFNCVILSRYCTLYKDQRLFQVSNTKYFIPQEAKNFLRKTKRI